MFAVVGIQIQYEDEGFCNRDHFVQLSERKTERCSPLLLGFLPPHEVNHEFVAAPAAVRSSFIRVIDPHLF